MHGFAIDEHHFFWEEGAASFSFGWSSESGDEGGRIHRGAGLPLVATPCGAFFPGGFVPLFPETQGRVTAGVAPSPGELRRAPLPQLSFPSVQP
jgi:hypothetical protein